MTVWRDGWACAFNCSLMQNWPRTSVSLIFGLWSLNFGKNVKQDEFECSVAFEAVLNERKKDMFVNCSLKNTVCFLKNTTWWIYVFEDQRPLLAALLVVKHVIGLLSTMVESASTPDMEPLIDEIVNQVRHLWWRWSLHLNVPGKFVFV